MAQADQTVQNNTFPLVRADINDNLAALFSNNSGTTAPSVTVAHMDWIDTSGTDPVWKKRNAANSGWITIGTIKTSTLELAAANVLPSQSGNTGKYLTTDGSTASWAALAPGSSVTTYTSSDTWTKPSSGTMVYVEVWGGGGGGARSSSTYVGGGGGGAFRWALIPMATLGATVTVTVGSGGSGQTATVSGTAGGNSSFGDIIAGGGSAGSSSSTSARKIRGGSWRTATSNGYGDVGDDNGSASTLLFGHPGDPDDVTSKATLFIGGVGSSTAGLDSVYGGGGGGGVTSATPYAGGTSTFGGNGGGSGGDGSIPAGGGAASGTGVAQAGSGARGEIRVYVW